MKTTSILAAIALLLLTPSPSMESDEYTRGYLDGYRHSQIEDLPAIGIKNHKRPADLLGKG